MKKLSLITIFVLSIIATFLSTWSLIRSYTIDEQELEYTIYIGTNDKDTFQLEIPLDEARSIIYNTMINEGYPLDYLNVEYNIGEINKKMEEIVNRTEKLDMNESLMELKVLLEYFDTLYNDFDKEKTSRKVLVTV